MPAAFQIIPATLSPIMRNCTKNGHEKCTTFDIGTDTIYRNLPWSSPLLQVYDSSSALRTPQMNPSLRSGRSVVVRIRSVVVPKDRLAIIPSLPHMIRVAGCNGSGNSWQARSRPRAPRIVTINSVCPYFQGLSSERGNGTGMPVRKFRKFCSRKLNLGSSLLRLILDLRCFLRLPLHVTRTIRTPALQRRNVIHNIAATSPRGLAGRGARIRPLKV